jgi:hypothetical protein
MELVLRPRKRKENNTEVSHQLFDSNLDYCFSNKYYRPRTSTARRSMVSKDWNSEVVRHLARPRMKEVWRKTENSSELETLTNMYTFGMRLPSVTHSTTQQIPSVI